MIISSTTTPRIIYNDDTCSLRVTPPPHRVNDIEKLALDLFIDSQVDALCWSMYSGIAYSWPSKVIENAFDLADRFEGLEINGKSNEKNLMLSLHKEGVDYLPILIETSRKRGIRFYGSFRMNDCHQKARPKGMLAGEFWRNHQDYRLWDVTDAESYYNAALDYSFPAVRQRVLSAIQEVLDWYDVDGIELDWGRNPYVFPESEAWEKRDILTDFIGEIRDSMDRAKQKNNKPMDLLIRVPFSQDRYLKYPEYQQTGTDRHVRAGMDIRAWLEKQYPDILIMTYLENNLNQSIEPWRSLCHEQDVLFYPSVESGVAQNAAYNNVVSETPEESVRRSRAMAQNYLAQQPDGIYMFNYSCKIREPKRGRMRTEEEFNQLCHVLHENGNLDTLSGKAKQYVFWESLPINVESYRPPECHQTIEMLLNDPTLNDEKSVVTISLRQVARKNPHSNIGLADTVVPEDWIVYYINGNFIDSEQIVSVPQPSGDIQSGFHLPRHSLVTIHASREQLTVGDNTLSFHIPKEPEEGDPYVDIYEVIVNIEPA